MPKIHGIELAQNSNIKNAVIETLAADPVTVIAGRLWLNSTSKLWKVGTEAGVTKILATQDMITTLETALASTGSGTSGSGLVRYEGYPTMVGAGTVKSTLDFIIGEIATLGTDSTTYSNQIATLQTNVGTIQTNIGNMANLATDVNTDLVSAIMFVDGINNTQDTDIASLQTTVGNHTTSISVINGLLPNYLDKTTSTAQSVIGDVTFDGTVRFTGEFIQTGATKTTLGEEVLFEDNIVVLNSNVLPAANPTEDAGFAVNRGNKGQLNIVLWNETTDTLQGVASVDGAGVGTYDDVAFKTDTIDLDTRLTVLEGSISGATGDLATLTTDAKTTLVAAINEVDAHTDTNTSNISTLSGTVSTLSTTVTNNQTAAATRITNEGSTTAGQGSGLIGFSGYTSVGSIVTLAVAAGTVENSLKTFMDVTVNALDSINGEVGEFSSTTAGLGLGLIGFSGHTGTNGQYSIPAGTAENAVISIATEIDAINQEITTLTSGTTTSVNNLVIALNNTKYHTTSASAIQHTITHNLGSQEISANVWVKDGSVWRNHIVGITIIDNNSIQIDLTEAYEIKVLVEKFDTISI